MRPTAHMLLRWKNETPPAEKEKDEAPGAAAPTLVQQMFVERAEVERQWKRLALAKESGGIGALAGGAKQALERTLRARGGMDQERLKGALQRIDSAEERFYARVNEQMAALEARIKAIDLRIAAAGGAPAPVKTTGPKPRVVFPTPRIPEASRKPGTRPAEDKPAVKPST
jgi:hypothetical protein